MTSVAAIVIAAGRHRHLRWLQRGLIEQTHPVDEVVVVEMDAARPVEPAVRAATTVVSLGDVDPGHLPLARARNVGAAAAAGHDVLVFLDIDCVPAPDLVDQYVTALASAPDRFVGGPVRYLREGWRPTPPIAGAPWWHHSDVAPGRVHPAPGARARPAPPDLFWSLSFATTPGPWAVVGGFDEGFVGYGAEDTDFARRAAATGLDLCFVGGGTVFHQWHPPSRFEASQLDGMIANAKRFRARWGDWPMSGWWHELAARRVVRFDPARDQLERAS